MKQGFTFNITVEDETEEELLFILLLYYFPFKESTRVNGKYCSFYLCDLQNFFGPEFVKMTIEPFISLDLPRSILVSNKTNLCHS